MLSYSVIVSDPRVRRQIDWLAEAGWTVDTLGLGDAPVEQVTEHFALAEPAPWLLTRWGTLLVHTLVPRRARFRSLLTDRVPPALVDRIRAGAYDLIVFNEYEFTPWVDDPRDFTQAARAGHLHLDMHEFHDPRLRRRTLGARLTGHHYRWVRRQIANPAFDSRTVVNAPIGRLYADEFGIPEPTPLRNAPPFVDQSPSAVEEDSIRLLFHGMAAWQRGFTEILDAMRVLPARFTMTFMLMPNAGVVERLQELIDEHPARDRIRIVPPAPMREISARINEYDIEIIFYRPLGTNFLYALPNKFFEAIQGRLALVVGESPAMAELVREHGNGVVVEGFEASDLVAALTDLTGEQLRRFKEASNVAARELNAAREGRAFLEAVDSTTDLAVP